MGKESIKRERFKSVASRRVQKVLDDLDSLSKCSNKAIYEYNDTDTRKMIKAINDKLMLLKLSFEATNTKEKKQSFEF